jgi:nucleoid-associated protein Lsr2
MATKVLTTLQDDIDGSAAVETVRFALDGVEWEIDLSERNANRLRNSLGVFIAHGRKVGGKRVRRDSSSSDVDSLAIERLRADLRAEGGIGRPKRDPSPTRPPQLQAATHRLGGTAGAAR